MPKTDITTLKSWFETGDVPTEQQFADLIDSFVHKDGTAKSSSDSFEVLSNTTGTDVLTTLRANTTYVLTASNQGTTANSLSFPRTPSDGDFVEVYFALNLASVDWNINSVRYTYAQTNWKHMLFTYSLASTSWVTTTVSHPIQVGHSSYQNRDIATKAEIVAGTENDKVISPKSFTDVVGDVDYDFKDGWINNTF